MNKLLAAMLLAGAGVGSAQATDVGVSIGISQPGVYGRVDIGRFPQPQVIVQQPVWVAPPQVYAQRPQPVYLWVPPGHREHWNRHCAAYGACGVPVYFVQDRWYRDHVVPRGGYGYREGYRADERYYGRGYERGYERGQERGQERGHDRGHDRDHDRDDNERRGRGHDRG